MIADPVRSNIRKVSGIKNQVRRELMRSRGIEVVGRIKGRVVVVRSKVGRTAPQGQVYKTPTQKQIELRLGLDIREVLSPTKSGYLIAKELGVTESAITRWRKQFGIETENTKKYFHGNRF